MSGNIHPSQKGPAGYFVFLDGHCVRLGNHGFINVAITWVTDMADYRLDPDKC